MMLDQAQETLVVGDIHGCREEFEQLLEVAGYHEGLRLVLAGDLINKGPDSIGVLRLARTLGAEVVAGNHEYGFLRYLAKGRPTHADFDLVYAQCEAELDAWVPWIERLPTHIETEDWLVVHAGLQPGKHPSETRAHLLANIRTWDGAGADLNDSNNPPWFDLYHGPRLVVFGHWARRGLVLRANAIGLDTGCVYGGQLSAVMLPARRIIQVPARKAYKAVGQ